MVRVQRRVVMDDGNAVPSHADVELQRIDPERDGALEPGERVFRQQSARAAMAVNFQHPRGIIPDDAGAETHITF